MRKVYAVCLIHLLEVCHIVEEDVDLPTIILVSILSLYSPEQEVSYLDNPFNTTPSSLKNSNDVLATRSCFVTNVSFYEFAISAARDLARNVDCASCYYGLALYLVLAQSSLCQILFRMEGEGGHVRRARRLDTIELASTAIKMREIGIRRGEHTRKRLVGMNLLHLGHICRNSTLLSSELFLQVKLQCSILRKAVRLPDKARGLGSPNCKRRVRVSFIFTASAEL
jgi:hypothetical protein